jgi:hypothetical protein
MVVMLDTALVASIEDVIVRYPICSMIPCLWIENLKYRCDVS